jgi:SAM-dependent methyltransferase
MDASGSHDANRRYYDAFATGYETQRGDNDPGGYHELLDELESEFVRRFGAGRDVLEVGCGTGLVLGRIAGFAKSATGVDLSPGMLERARSRGLDVREASATALPFDDQSFDVTCSFKVLAHIPDIERALSEMARVTRPGGHVIAEFYNPCKTLRPIRAGRRGHARGAGLHALRLPATGEEARAAGVPRGGDARRADRDTHGARDAKPARAPGVRLGRAAVVRLSAAGVRRVLHRRARAPGLKLA